MSYHFACITFEWNYEHSYNLLQGMQKYVQENKNIKFTVFNALAKYIDQQVDVSALGNQVGILGHSMTEMKASFFHLFQNEKLNIFA